MLSAWQGRTDEDHPVFAYYGHACTAHIDYVTRKSGIYEYLLTGEEKKLSIRSFDRRDALAAYEKQHHKCALCGETFEFEQMHADHILPWSRGGKTTPDNCQMLCVKCNLAKGGSQIYSMHTNEPAPVAAEPTTAFES